MTTGSPDAKTTDVGLVLKFQAVGLTLSVCERLKWATSTHFPEGASTAMIDDDFHGESKQMA